MENEMAKVERWYLQPQFIGTLLMSDECCIEGRKIGTANLAIRDSLGQTPLHLACKYGRHKTIESLIARHAPVNAVDFHGRTALHLAVARQDLHATKILLSGGADPAIKTLAGFSPLFFAVQAGCTVIVELLANHGGDVNELVVDQDLKRQYSYLHKAVESNLVLVVETLLRYKADVNVRDSYGNTSLHLASRHGCSDIACLLLAHGAQVHDRDQNDLTALYFAVDGGHKDLFDLLLLHGADLKDRDVSSASLLHLAIKHGNLDFLNILLSKGTDVDAATRFGKTPLHYAIAEKNWTALKLLIDHGADINRRDRYGKTPLHSAIESYRKEAFEILLSHRANTNVQDNLLQSPLHAAVKQGCADMVQKLLHFEAVVDARDSNGQTPLHHAVRLAHSHLFKYLLKSQADVNAVDVNGNTPLHLAVISEHSKLLYVMPEFTFFSSLLENGADIFKKTSSTGETALHLAVSKRCAPFVRKLLSRGAEVNVRKATTGMAPLHLAVENADSECVEYLLTYGADYELLDKNGKTPIDLINCRVIANVFARYFLMKGVAGFPVNETKAKQFVQQEDLDFANRCTDEIKRMAAIGLHGDVTCYDFLRGTRRSLVGFVEHREVKQIFRHRVLKSSFPIYATMLERNYEIGTRFETILDEATEIFSAICHHELPSVPVEKVISYLSVGDMKNLLLAIPSLPIAFSKKSLQR